MLHSRQAKAKDLLRSLGKRLYETFFGFEGDAVLYRISSPTAVLFNVDETILNLPWELIGSEDAIGSVYSLRSVGDDPGNTPTGP